MTGRLPRLHGHRVQLCPARTTYTKMIGRAVAGAVAVRIKTSVLYAKTLDGVATRPRHPGLVFTRCRMEPGTA
jgi:hypothetical protein